MLGQLGQTAPLNRLRRQRGLCVWALAISQITFAAGCRSDGYGGSSSGGSNSTAPGSTAGPNLGEIIYGVLHTNLQTNGTTAEVSALEADHVTFVGAVNQILPTNVSSNLWPLVQKVLPLVDDGTIPAGMGDMEGMIKDLLASPNTINAMADLSSLTAGKSSLDPKDAIRLVSRLLAYPQLDTLASASDQLVTAKPSILTNLQSLLAGKLKGMTAATFNGNGLGLSTLSSTLLAPADVAGIGSLGAPAWAVHVDKNGNPAATVDPATNHVVAPFVDDGTGTAAVNTTGQPVDATGNPITLTPFGTDGTRDSDGRALAANGLPVFQYFDAKQTLLGVALYLVGQMLQKNVTNDFVTVLNGVVPRVNSGGVSVYGPQDPFIDLADSQVELVRRAPIPQLLEGLAVLVKQNPTGFEQMVTSLVQGINLAKQSGFSTNGQTQLINDLLPLLTDAAKPQGNNVSAVRALLESFNSAQAQLQNLPQGFAIMMQYSDYKNKVLTDATHISSMQKLLEIMQASAGCTVPLIGGNVADMYLDALAGNGKPILGLFTLSVSTLNQLVQIPVVRQLLCSSIKDSDVNALQDFADSGTLNAFIPIAKAFSDRGETHLLTEIMLALGADYPTAMTPNEPAIIKLLNSGAVNQLFAAINQMTQIQVPSNQEMLIDVLADVFGAMVDDSNPFTDRQGRTQKTLINLMMAPISDLYTAAQNAGVQTNLDNIMSTVGGALLATYTDSSGNTKLVYNVFITTLGGTLDFLSKQIPSDATSKSTWCDQQEQSIGALLEGSDLATLCDLLSDVQQSPNAQVFTDAIVNLFTPANDRSQDVFGAILQLLAGLIQVNPALTTLSSQQASDLAAIVNFLGQEIDPAAGKLTNMMTMIQKFAAVDSKLLLLQVIRNAMDMGTSGNGPAPVQTLMQVFSDIRNADGGSTGGGMTGTQLTTTLNNVVKFMDDQTNGLPHIFDMIKHRNG